MSRQRPPGVAPTAESVRDLYRTVVADVARRERDMEDELPEAYETVGLGERLERPLEQWERGEKPIRTLPTVIAWESALGESLSATLVRTLVDLDVTVTALDDIIDTKELTREEKISLTSIVTFAALDAVATLPSEGRARFVDEITRYVTQVAQTPAVERAALADLAEAGSPDEELTAARTSYAFRARDINAFATLPAVKHDVVDERISNDLCAYRAHELLYEDLVDVDLDLRDENETPLLHLMRRYDDSTTVAERFRALYDSFPYSEASRDTYRADLRELEGAPDDLVGCIERAMATINE